MRHLTNEELKIYLNGLREFTKNARELNEPLFIIEGVLQNIRMLNALIETKSNLGEDSTEIAEVMRGLKELLTERANGGLP